MNFIYAFTPYVKYIFGENLRGFEHIRLILYHAGWLTVEFLREVCVVLLAKRVGLI